MKKALIVATVSGFVPQFEMNNVKLLQGLGYEVHYASNFKNPHYGQDNRRLEGTGVACHQVDFVRSPFRIPQNIKAYAQLCRLMEGIPFSLIHCHTPMGGVLGRLAARRAKRPARVIYTAHGFHFYKGAPLWNWLVYYPAERLLARATDILITMNEEDYRRAQAFRLRGPGREGGRVRRIHGVGIDVDSYNGIRADRAGKRCGLGIREDDFVFLSVGELSKRKNHEAVIKAFISIRGKQEALGRKKSLGAARAWRYLIAGEGEERKHLEGLIRKNNLGGQVSLLGYREDVKELLAIADCFVFPSKQEGMPVALLEAALAGVPLVASDIRGNREVVEAAGPMGHLYQNQGGLEESLKEACRGERKPGENRGMQSLRCFSQAGVMEEMKRIYCLLEQGG